jgi:hypothetical protein
MIRALVLAVTLLALFPAHAAPCWAVRKAISQYGEAGVESGARSKSISEKEIEKARHCL